MDRDVVLVTGGNSGIGFECARQLARAGWHVLIASRNRRASAEAVDRIARDSGADAASELGLDLGSTAAVRQFVREIDARDVPLRALVCNAGLQVHKGPSLSPDGYELTFAVNHLGHFLLTNLLLARLVRNAPARIVIVASGVHDPKFRTGMPKPAVADLAALAKVALDPELDRTSGRYFPSHARWRAARSSDASYDQAQARALWDASVGFARLAPGESPLLTSA